MCDARLRARAGELERELGGVDDGARVGVEQAGEIGRRIDFGTHPSPSRKRPSPSAADSSSQPTWCGSVATDSMPVRCQSTSRLEPLDLGLHAVEVLHAHRVELVDLVGPPRLSVLKSVGQARVDEPAVATRRRPADAVGLDQHDALVRIALCGMQCRPQPGVAAADDQQVAGDRRGQARIVGPLDVEPHRSEGACGQRTFDQCGSRPWRRTPFPQLGPYGLTWASPSIRSRGPPVKPAASGQR